MANLIGARARHGIESAIDARTSEVRQALYVERTLIADRLRMNTVERERKIDFVRIDAASFCRGGKLGFDLVAPLPSVGPGAAAEEKPYGEKPYEHATKPRAVHAAMVTQWTAAHVVYYRQAS